MSIPKLPRVSNTTNHHPMQVIDMQYAQDVVEAIRNMSMAELHALRVSANGMDADRFFKIINVSVNRMNALEIINKEQWVRGMEELLLTPNAALSDWPGKEPKDVEK